MTEDGKLSLLFCLSVYGVVIALVLLDIARAPSDKI